MRMRSRKLVGSMVMIAFVIAYALAAMGLAQGRVTEASRLVQGLYYAVLGLAWIFPAMLIIRWMERPD